MLIKETLTPHKTDDLTKDTKLINNKDGTISDNLNGLMWQREDDVEKNYEDALEYCNNLTLGGFHDWRLPRKEELLELAKVGFDKLKIAFPNIKKESYWAITTMPEVSWAPNPDQIAYTVDFLNPGPTTYFRRYKYYVRAVRNP